MAEIKNTFLKSKMNKDLDSRLIPNGEYRDAQNISISRSEDSDVGAVENILGNELLSKFGLDAQCGLEIIGQYTDVVNDRVIVMLTNYTDSSNDKLSHHALLYKNITGGASQVKCYIAMHNVRTNEYNILVSGDWLNFSKTHIITGINLIEDLLFWTDNRNQPRKININSAQTNPSYYTSENHVSVAKYYPFQPAKLIRYNASTLSYESTMRDVVSEFLPDGTTSNPYYDANFKGDAELLKDKFIRFSYRFKFDDGEYSLIAPFTQIAFVPEQDGYFIQNGSTEADIKKAFQSTEVKFMRNKINELTLMIPPPVSGVGTDTWANARDNFKIDEIEILSKESDSTTIKVIDNITWETFQNTTTLPLDLYRLPYKYSSTKPIKTLPSKEITRVSDITPVRAQAQESSGNRIIYGNYRDKHTPPKTINYSVTVADKGDNVVGNPIVSQIRKEYQNHHLKQNRSYTVGIVLSDMYGRQSDVIDSKYDLNTILNEYNTKAFSETIGANNLYSSTDTWPGNCLRVSFAEEIPENLALEGYPGLWSEQNPLGWKSFKVVVQQKQQEYYNVYFPGILNGYTNPRSLSTFDEPVCHIVLTGDNINKVPRDLSEVGPDQKTFKSTQYIKDNFADLVGDLLIPAGKNADEVFRRRARELGVTDVDNASLILYPRVVNTSSTAVEQYYPYSDNNVVYDEVVTIGTARDLDLLSDSGDIKDLTLSNAFNYSPATGVTSPAQLSGGSGTGLFATLNFSATGDIDDVTMSTTIGGIKSFNINNAGSGYSVGPASLTPVTGTGNGATIYIEEVSGLGAIIKARIVDAGTAYTTASAVNISGGTSGQLNNLELGGVGYKDGEIVTWPIANSSGQYASFKVNIENENPEFYASGENPLIAKIIPNDYTIGVYPYYSQNDVTNFTFGPMRPALSIYETETTNSNLDIYWETSTVGLISALNTNIRSNTVGAVDSWHNPSGVAGNYNFAYAIGTLNQTWSEGDTSGTVILSDFNAWETATSAIINPATMILLSVYDGNNVDQTSKFSLVAGASPSSYRLQTNSALWYQQDASANQFSFDIQVTKTGAPGTISTRTIGPLQLANAAPSFTASTFPATATGSTSGGALTLPAGKSIDATNGSTDTNNNKKELTFNIESQVDSGLNNVNDFFLSPQTIDGTVILNVNRGVTAGVYSVKLNVVDAGNISINSSTITITIS